jgi:pimeloyl-ACP methyl ester carboxylesterase
MSPSRKPIDESTSRVRLEDGRALAYFSIGDPDGAPVFFFHGTPGSRLLPDPAGPVAERQGVHLIGVDRPGFGLSDPLRGRALTDWPADVRQLAGALGIERFGLLGVSSGGPYVLACCAAMPELVTRALTVGGLTPSRRPALISDESSLPRPLIFALRKSRLLARVVYRLLGISMRKNPDRARAELAKGLSETDGRILERPDAGGYIFRAGAESIRNGAGGWVDDDHLLSRPWGFSPAEISPAVELHLWYGGDDLAVPEPEARSLSEMLPGARLKMFPGEGHMLIFDHMEEAIATLAGHPPETGSTA